MEFSRTERRLVEVGMVVSALAHLLAPGVLARVVRWGYATGLDVEFSPGEGTARRVRLLGVLSLVAVPVVRRVLR